MARVDRLLYRRALEVAHRAKYASPGLFQHELKISYETAKGLLGLMERDGVVGPADGARPRELVSRGPMLREHVHSITDFYGFPYKSFEALCQAIRLGQVVIGADEVKARLWVNHGESAPRMAGWYSLALSWMYFLVPLAVVVLGLASGRPGLAWFAIPLFVGFLLLRPAYLRLRYSPFKLIVLLGHTLTLLGLFGILSTLSLYWGLAITIPWLINWHIYRHAANVATGEALRSEDRFVELFKHGVIGLVGIDGDTITWGNDYTAKG